jgi:hypothetical protein
MLASTSLDATELASTRSVNFHLFSLTVHPGQFPALSTTSHRLALVGLEDDPLNQLVGTNLDGIDILVLAQFQGGVITRLGAVGKFIVSEILGGNAIDTMATGMDGDFFNGAVVVMIKLTPTVTAVVLGECKLDFRFRLFAVVFRRGIFRRTLDRLFFVLSFVRLFMLGWFRLFRLLLGSSNLQIK